MAIDYKDYAASYSGGIGAGYQAGATLGQGLGAAFGAIPTFKDRFGMHSKEQLESIMSPLMAGYMGNIEDFTLMGEGGQSLLMNPGQAFKQFKSSVDSRGGGFARKAYKKGYVDPIGFKEGYDQYMTLMSPAIGNKILSHAVNKGRTDKDMREFVSSKNLNNFILSNFQDEMNVGHQKLREWATPQRTLATDIKGWKEWAQEPWTIGDIAKTTAGGIAGAGLTAWGVNKALKSSPAVVDAVKAFRAKPTFGLAKTARDITFKSGYGSQRSKDLLKSYKSMRESSLVKHGGPGMKDKGVKILNKKITTLSKNIAKNEALIESSKLKQPISKLGSALKGAKNLGVYVGLPWASSEVAGLAGADDKGKALAGQSMRTLLSTTTVALERLVKKKGAGWLIKQMAKKGGISLGLQLATKLGLGAVGGIATGGVMAGIMGALAVADVIRLGKMIFDISSEIGLPDSALPETQPAQPTGTEWQTQSGQTPSWVK